MPHISVLAKRADFLLAANSGFKFVKPSIVVQARKRSEEENAASSSPAIRIGFTATKKLGNAVIRNRAKRRMRAAAARLAPEFGLPGCDYVFIAREQTYKGKFNQMLHDMRRCLKCLGEQITYGKHSTKNEPPTASRSRGHTIS